MNRIFALRLKLLKIKVIKTTIYIIFYCADNYKIINLL
jgi:hypothetical protein